MSEPIAAGAAAVPISASAKCPICLDDMRDRAVAIPCCHDFDFTCISEWVPVNSNCPVCRTPMDCIHHNIKSMSSFSILNVVPTASANADHGHDEYEDSEDLDFDDDFDTFDEMEGDTLSLLDDSDDLDSVISNSGSSPPAQDLSVIVEEDDSHLSHSPSPQVSEADGTIVVSDDSDNDDDDDDIYADTTDELDEEPAEILIPDDDGAIEIVPLADEDDEIASEEGSVSVDDYGDEPDDWSDDFNDAHDEFEDDYSDGFDDDDHSGDW